MPAYGLTAATEAGVRLVQSVGVEAIHERVEDLAGRVIDGLRDRDIPVRTPRDPQWRAGVVAADVADAPALASWLRARGVDVGGYPWGLLRVDPHAFCQAEDIDRFLAGLDAYRAASR
jgi:selenocysteine lyase/cysteine desulfurase